MSVHSPESIVQVYNYPFHWSPSIPTRSNPIRSNPIMSNGHNAYYTYFLDLYWNIWTIEQLTSCTILDSKRKTHLSRLVRKAHPNLFETMELIKNEQASPEVQMIQLTAGGQPRPKKRKAVRQDEQIKRLVAEFSNGQRTLDSFLSALANTVVDFS